MAKFASYESMTSEKGWFSVIPLLSYGAFINMLIGARSLGKSVAVALWVLFRYLKNGEQFIYTRRNADTLKLTAEDWFASACRILNENDYEFDFEYKGGLYLINGEVAGYAVPLNMQHKYKGRDFINVWWICFDEFIADISERYEGQNINFLTEYDCLIKLAQTADRTVGRPRRSEVKIFCMGNAESLYNPVIVGTGADRYIREDSHFVHPKGKKWAVQLLREDDSASSQGFTDYVYYELASENLKAMAYDNRPKEFKDSPFIKTIKKPLMPLCNFVWDGKQFGFYADRNAGIFYLSKKLNSCHDMIALSIDDHKPNYFLARNGNVYIGLIKETYAMGQLFFETNEIKTCIDSFLKFVR